MLLFWSDLIKPERNQITWFIPSKSESKDALPFIKYYLTACAMPGSVLRIKNRQY